MTNYSELIEEIRAMREEGIPDLEGIEGKVIGICSTCKHTDTCAYLLNATAPIFHCEEFDVVKAENAVVDTEVKNETEEVKESIEYKGLCKNCEKRMTCVYSNSESGIWNCEEYE